MTRIRKSARFTTNLLTASERTIASTSFLKIIILIAGQYDRSIVGMEFPTFCVALEEKVMCGMTSQLMNKLRGNFREEEEELKKNDCTVPVFVQFPNKLRE